MAKAGANKNVIERVVVAAILVPLVVVSVFFVSKGTLGVILAIVTALAAYELAQMSPMKSNINVTYVFAAIVGAFPIVVSQAGKGYLAVAMFLAIMAALVIPMTLSEDIKKRFDKMLWFVLGVCYIGFFMVHFQLLWGIKGGSHMLMLVMIIVWVNDIGAYFVGSMAGKNKMSPELSPKKTYEGLVGGAAAAIGSAYIYYAFHKFSIGPEKLFILAFAVVVAAVVGDLFESFIKRYSGVKDSGTLLKGHGGVLDRIDSLLFAVPVAYYVIRYL